MDERTGDNRPVRYIEVAADGTETIVYRASGLGGCLRALAAHGQGYTPTSPPDWIVKRWNEGHLLEDAILERYEKLYGDPVTHRQVLVELEIGEINGRRVIVRGHIDGLTTRINRLAGGTYRLVVDAKAFRDDYWAKINKHGAKAFEGYVWQQSVYVIGLEAKGAELAVAWKSGEDDDLTIQDFKVFDVPMKTLFEIKRRVAKIEALIESGELGACDQTQYPCPFFYLHDADANEPPERVADETLEVLVKKYHEAARAAALADAEKKAAGEGIKGWFEANGLKGEKRTVGDFTVTNVIAWQPEKTVRGFEQNYVRVTEQPTNKNTKSRKSRAKKGDD